MINIDKEVKIGKWSKLFKTKKYRTALRDIWWLETINELIDKSSKRRLTIEDVGLLRQAIMDTSVIEDFDWRYKNRTYIIHLYFSSKNTEMLIVRVE